jgi:hypothetical protein
MFQVSLFGRCLEKFFKLEQGNFKFGSEWGGYSFISSWKYMEPSKRCTHLKWLHDYLAHID